jgi:BioD-like phosphotransacetylase family protein
MPALLIASPEPLAGRTTLAVGLAQQLERRGQRVALLRLAGDEGAPADAETLGRRRRPRR